MEEDPVYLDEPFDFNANSQALWARIRDFPLDRGKTGDLSARLRRERGWGAEFTQRVIEEYKRFLWIAATSGQEVTPSRAVDEVWHMHILHTKSYFDDLCCNTLGFTLHHNPGDGSHSDTRFKDNYSNTLRLYAASFGDPPRDIWPQPRAVDATPRTRWGRLPSLCAGLVAAPAQAATQGSGGGGGSQLLLILFLLHLGVLLVMEAIRGGRKRKSKKPSRDSGGGSDGVPYDTNERSSDTNSKHCADHAVENGHGDHCGDGVGGHGSCGANCGSSCGSGCGSGH